MTIFLPEFADRPLTSAAAQTVPEQVIRIEPAQNSPNSMPAVIGIALVLGFALLVSWLAAMILNWSMAPRRFWPRVVAAGTLPISMFIGVFFSLEIFGRNRTLPDAFERLLAIPVRGQLLLTGMLIVGFGISWLTAILRNRREARKAQSALNAFT